MSLLVQKMKWLSKWTSKCWELSQKWLFICFSLVLAFTLVWGQSHNNKKCSPGQEESVHVHNVAVHQRRAELLDREVVREAQVGQLPWPAFQACSGHRSATNCPSCTFRPSPTTCWSPTCNCWCPTSPRSSRGGWCTKRCLSLVNLMWFECSQK